MKMVNLVNSLALILVYCLNQFVRVDCGCQGGVSICDWTSWSEYEPCNGECGGGLQWRKRRLCCTPEYLNGDQATQECLDKCDKKWSGFRESRACTGRCYNGGTHNGVWCQCRAGYTGQCCDYVCDKFHYGQNCAYQCRCGVGASRCDSVTGCVCKAGYSGTKCQNDINECHASPIPCQAVNTECVNTPGSYRCDCIEGFFEVNNVCRDIDECSHEGLPTCEQSCENDIGSYTCSCRAGYNKQGNACEDIDECESSPCQRGGQCINKENGYECDCPDNAYGVHCEQDICQPRPSDIVFILDSSVSMTEADFRKELDFIALFVDELTIGPEDFQISIITFSFDSKIEFYLDTHQTKVSLKEAINNIKYRPGATFTHTGLESARNVFFYEETNSNRPTIRSWTVQKYVFVLTDGMSNHRQKTKVAAQTLRGIANRVVAIGIGMEVSHKELLDIASEGEVFSVDNFNSLYTIIHQMIHDRCQKCYNSSMSDIVFLIDESSYIAKQEFQTAIDDITYFVNNMEIHMTDVGPHIAIDTFGEAIARQTVLKLNHGKDKSVLLPLLQNLIQNEGSCHKKNKCIFNIIEAIQETIDKAFLPENGGRENAKKFIILLSNGKFELATNEIGQDDVTLFVIGLGLDVSMNRLLSLVKDSNNVFLTRAGEEPTNLDVILTEFTYSQCDLKS